MNVLPDTSVWVDYLRRGRQGSAKELDDLLQGNRVVIAGPVLAQILAGIRVNDRDKLWNMMRSLPWAPLDADAWHQVGDTAARLREGGVEVPLTDIEIAVSAVAVGAALWTRDSDFTRILTVLPDLTLYSPSTA